MRPSAKTIFLIVLLMALYLIPGYGPSKAQSQEAQKTGAVDGAAASAIPDLADIVPKKTALTGRLAALENRLKGGPDIPAIQKRYDEISVDLEMPSGRRRNLARGKKRPGRELMAGASNVSTAGLGHSPARGVFYFHGFRHFSQPPGVS